MSQKRRKDTGEDGNPGQFTAEQRDEAEGVILQGPQPGRERLVARYGERAARDIEFLIATCDEVQLVLDRGREAFLGDVLLQRAVEGCAGRIGDTISNKVPPELQEEFGGRERWSALVGWRVVLAHKYHRVLPARVWNDALGIPGFRRFLVDDVLGDGA